VGKIFGKIVGIAGVTLAECEGKFESRLGWPGYLSVVLLTPRSQSAVKPADWLEGDLREKLL